MIQGDFRWTGDLPDDDEIESWPKPEFSVNFGEEWQHLATRPLMEEVCGLLRSDPVVSSLNCSQPANHGWYATFSIGQWKCQLFVQWIGCDGSGDDHDDNLFEFEARFCHQLFHRLVHRSQYAPKLRKLGATVVNALSSCPHIESIVALGVGPVEYESDQ